MISISLLNKKGINFMQPEQPDFSQTQPQPQPVQVPPPSQTGQLVQAQPTTQISDQAQKKINNSGRSTFFFGIFLTLLWLAGLLMSALANPPETQGVVVSVLFLVLYVPLILIGRSLKKSSTISEAKRKINIAIGLSVAAIIYSILVYVITDKTLSVSCPLSILLAIYLIVVSARLKN